MHMDTVMDFGLAEEMIWISVQSEDEPEASTATEAQTHVISCVT